VVKASVFSYSIYPLSLYRYTIYRFSIYRLSIYTPKDSPCQQNFNDDELILGMRLGFGMIIVKCIGVETRKRASLRTFFSPRRLYL